MRKRLGELRADMAPDEREKVAGELDKLRDVLTQMAKVVRGRP